METKSGKIIKGIGGFYYVQTNDGVVECRARGKFRKDSVVPYVGDNVIISIENDGNGYVVEIEQRKNCFVRPPISNVDKLLIVSALANPSPDSLFIDKMLVNAEIADVEAALCFNKADLSDDAEIWMNTYHNSGYKVFVTSTTENTGIDEVKDFMKNSLTAVCGFSGVGKSSLLNKITNSTDFEVGEISAKLSRGKHTTRHVELIEIADNSFLADTPGFSMLSLPEGLSANELISYFPDLKIHTKSCRFADCNHTSGKFCGVVGAVENGYVSQSRYENYKYLYNSLKDNKEWKK
ncbi:MAG: ribosome small subunit-dependent GTPase A [Ruminococcaceae bacterium]|nr:ribosome small subunit-dependent GTPase A [Oscillospiraceae bacterium]